jgi:hypothetical protein
MSSCWKCGRDVPEGQVECEYGCGDPVNDKVREGLMRLFRDSSVEIDWNKVTCLADLIALLRVFYAEVRIVPGTAVYEQLKRFLKEGK